MFLSLSGRSVGGKLVGKEAAVGLFNLFKLLVLLCYKYTSERHRGPFYRRRLISSLRIHIRSSLFSGMLCSHSRMHSTLIRIRSSRICCHLLTLCNGAFFISSSFSSVLCCGQRIGRFSHGISRYPH